MEHKHNLSSLHGNKHKESLSSAERFAFRMHKKIGSLSFFFFLLVWTVVWLGWNIFAPLEMRFDPAPAFVIWLFASNIMQLIFLPIIMVGQNIEGRAAERRAESDYEVNMKAEKEIGIIMNHLENQAEVLEDLRRKIESR